jgi:hypothetical protein
MSARPQPRVFVLRLAAKPGSDAVRALRKYQLRCTSIEEIASGGSEARMRNDAPIVLAECAAQAPSFADACRRADQKRRRKRVDPAIERARALMDDDKVVSIEAAYAAFDRERRKYGAAWSTVEALVYSLRERGTAALQERSARHRLAQLSEAQLIAVGDRLQLLKPEIARVWTPDEVGVLVSEWERLHVV